MLIQVQGDVKHKDGEYEEDRDEHEVEDSVYGKESLEH